MRVSIRSQKASKSSNHSSAITNQRRHGKMVDGWVWIHWGIRDPWYTTLVEFISVPCNHNAHADMQMVEFDSCGIINHNLDIWLMIFQDLARYIELYNQNIFKYQIMVPLCRHIIDYKRYNVYIAWVVGCCFCGGLLFTVSQRCILVIPGAH